MSLRRVALELAIEREVGGADGQTPMRVRLTSRFEVDAVDGAVRPDEIAEALRQLLEEADRSIGTPDAAKVAPSRPDRPIAELVETYRPRQVELIDLLAEEGEVTPGEASALRAHLVLSRSATGVQPPPHREAEPAPLPAEVEPPVQDRPLAALPLVNDRTPTEPRPIDRLIREYRIESLKQAGAVRARREISYEEYMALKRHFVEREVAATSSPGGAT
ncbi:MAG: hypothetical protein ACREDK_06115 [Thermoplasmata archaeon]